MSYLQTCIDMQVDSQTCLELGPIRISDNKHAEFTTIIVAEYKVGVWLICQSSATIDHQQS